MRVNEWDLVRMLIKVIMSDICVRECVDVGFID